MRRENMESTPEVPQSNPTEASKGFLKGWGDSVVIGLNVTSIALDGFLTGLNAAQGHNEAALAWGIATGCLSLATVLKGMSMNAKSHK